MEKVKEINRKHIYDIDGVCGFAVLQQMCGVASMNPVENQT